MPNPKITIITPSYNQGQFIEETILSIINQGYPNLEYIIIDGGSTDNTVDIIKKYEQHITYWVSEPDKGQSHAINKGIAAATGDVFNWINSDDMLLPGSLHIIGEAFQNNEVHVVCTPIELLHTNGTRTQGGPTIYEIDMLSLFLSQGLTQPGMYWSMDIIRALRGVNPIFKYSMDLDLWKRYVLTYGTQQCRTIPTPTCIFRFHENSKTGGSFEDNFEKFALENNAALQQYVKVAGVNYVKAMQYLFPDYSKQIAQENSYTAIPVQTIQSNVTQLLYNKAQKAFYAEQFSQAYTLCSFIDTKYLNAEQQKNVKAFKRWSFYKKIFSHEKNN